MVYNWKRNGAFSCTFYGGNSIIIICFALCVPFYFVKYRLHVDGVAGHGKNQWKPLHCKCISMDCDWRWRYGTNRNFKGDWATLLPIAKSSGRDSSQMKIATTTTATKRYHVLESQPTNSYTVQMELWLDIAISFEFKQCITNGISSEIRENWMATREKNTRIEQNAAVRFRQCAHTPYRAKYLYVHAPASSRPNTQWRWNFSICLWN